MNILENAEAELRRAGLFDADSDYNGNIGHAVMDLMRAFAGKGHSGGSAMLTLAVFNKLAKFKSLTPITNDPAEWTDVSAMSGAPMWQNARQSSCFSTDGGKTHYDIDAGDEREVRTTEPAE